MHSFFIFACFLCLLVSISIYLQRQLLSLQVCCVSVGNPVRPMDKTKFKSLSHTVSELRELVKKCMSHATLGWFARHLFLIPLCYRSFLQTLQILIIISRWLTISSSLTNTKRLLLNMPLFISRAQSISLFSSTFIVFFSSIRDRLLECYNLLNQLPAHLQFLRDERRHSKYSSKLQYYLYKTLWESQLYDVYIVVFIQFFRN